MKKLGIVLMVVALTLALGLVPMASVSAAHNGGATVFITGGGNIKNDDGELLWTFGGNVGLLKDGSYDGQFQIIDHANNESWHCNDDFSSLVFSGSPIEGPPGPSAGCSVATFTGTFTSNRGNTAILTVVITDVYEPGKGNDTIFVTGDLNFSGNPISGGNFQMHKGTSPSDPNSGPVS
jgi:hypothetical protein